MTDNFENSYVEENVCCSLWQENRLNFVALGVGAAGKSTLINTLYKIFYFIERPSAEYPKIKNRIGTKELKIYKFEKPRLNQSPHFNRPFNIMDTQGDIFENLDMIHKVLEGLPEGTTWDNWMQKPTFTQNKPDFAFIVIDVRFVLYNEDDISWYSSWIFSPSYEQRQRRLNSLKILKVEIENKLDGQDRSAFVFTHMDEVSPKDKAVLEQLIADSNISQKTVFYACRDKSKCTQMCRFIKCDHWTKETEDGYIRMFNQLHLICNCSNGTL